MFVVFFNKIIVIVSVHHRVANSLFWEATAAKQIKIELQGKAAACLPLL